MSKTYDPDCVRCRVLRPGATEDHRDHGPRCSCPEMPQWCPVHKPGDAS